MSSSRPERLWLFRVEQMLDILARIAEYTRCLDAEKFRTQPMAVDAVVRNLIILGVAARRVPREVAGAHPGIPWRELQNIGVALDNSYDRTDADMIWHTVQTDLQPLATQLRQVLASQGRMVPEGPRPQPRHPKTPWDY